MVKYVNFLAMATEARVKVNAMRDARIEFNLNLQGVYASIKPVSSVSAKLNPIDPPNLI